MPAPTHYTLTRSFCVAISFIRFVHFIFEKRMSFRAPLDSTSSLKKINVL